MPHFYVPIERKTLPADDLSRWTILVFDTHDASTAQMLARTFVDQLPTRGWCVWAAVQDCPTFSYMAQLRESMDACHFARGGRKRGPIGSFIPGYS